MRLDAVLEGFWLSRRRRLSVNTQRDYELTFRRLVDQIGAGTAFEKIATRRLNDFMNWLADDLELSQKTQLNHWIALSALWTWAEKELGTKHVVHLGVERPRPRQAAIVPFTEQEVRLMLAGCDQMNGWDTSKGERVMAPRRDRAIVLVLVETGLRASELCGLRVKDYDRRRGQIFVASGKGDKERAGQRRQSLAATLAESVVATATARAQALSPIAAAQGISQRAKMGENYVLAEQ